MNPYQPPESKSERDSSDSGRRSSIRSTIVVVLFSAGVCLYFAGGVGGILQIRLVAFLIVMTALVLAATN